MGGSSASLASSDSGLRLAGVWVVLRDLEQFPMWRGVVVTRVGDGATLVSRRCPFLFVSFVLTFHHKFLSALSFLPLCSITNTGHVSLRRHSELRV